MKKIIRGMFLLGVLSMSLGTSGVAFAQTTSGEAAKYVVLSPLPGTTENNCTEGECKSTLATYLPGLFNLAIGVGAVTAFIMLTVYGFEYMLTDSLNTKTNSKKRILDALWGLGIVIFAYAILNTLNPALVAGNLNIANPKVPDAEVVASSAIVSNQGSTNTGSGVGCLGTCPYTYNNGGTTINFKDCSNCALATSFGLNIKTTTVAGRPTQINKDLGTKLKALQSVPGLTAFQVTETWPPTVNHREQGQYDGTSVDVGIFNASPENIKAFVNNADAKGLRAVWEVSTPTEAARIRTLTGLSASQVISVGYITGSHFSIYNK